MKVRSRIKTVLTIVVASLALIAVSASAVEVIGELGILDVTANGGINPNTGVAWAIGDQYRLAFHTVGATGKIDSTSNDPAVYNDYVTAEAHANEALAGSIWFALVCVNLDGTVTEAESPKSDPRVISGTDDQAGGSGQGGAGVPVYAMDGTTCIARNNADIWNSWSNPFEDSPGVPNASGTGNNAVRLTPPTSSQNVHYSPFLDQFGNQTVNPDDVHGIDVATGCSNTGTPINPLGNTTDNTTMNRGNANANNTGRVWNRYTNNTTDKLSFYALSEVLTIQDAFADPNLPDVDSGDDWISWSGQAVTLAPVVVNNDTEVPQRTLSYVWTADP
ncbi:MAG: hypothetical protein K9M75_11065, partial [Phycisphaerae bacterium]|nr:hypothetical protein [Phycisphaerae bacterium]